MWSWKVVLAHSSPIERATSPWSPQTEGPQDLVQSCAGRRPCDSFFSCKSFFVKSFMKYANVACPPLDGAMATMHRKSCSSSGLPTTRPLWIARRSLLSPELWSKTLSLHVGCYRQLFEESGGSTPERPFGYYHRYCYENRCR